MNNNNKIKRAWECLNKRDIKTEEEAINSFNIENVNFGFFAEDFNLEELRELQRKYFK